MDLLGQDPAAGYLQIYREQFASEAEAFWEATAAQSGIDPCANAAKAAEFRALKELQERCSGKKAWWIFLLVLIIAVLVIWGLGIDGGIPPEKQPLHWGIFITAALGGILLIFCKVVPAIKNLSERAEKLREEADEKHAELRAQLAPLFELFSWDTLTELFSKVITPVRFDPFLFQERLDDLRENFGFLLEDEPDSTLTGVLSGTFYGYPFVFTEDVNFSWGEKSWSGSITIHYRERVPSGDGKYVWVDRSQVLTASVVKPCPEFTTDKNFFFGHDAAPHLSFSRTPSSLSGGSGFWNALAKKYKMHKLKKFEQNLEDESQYTMVSNHDFEVLFQTENRDHEVEFRVLYTPLAQQYMVKLLNDRSGGYGDDFVYIKQNCVTRICSEHLNGSVISPPPFFSQNIDLQEIKKEFQSSSAEFFRSLYFTMAPVFLVPVYNEPRLDAPDEEGFSAISPSEIEGAAYSHSEFFAPEESITENIFNVLSCTAVPGGVHAVIEAIGFAGIEHTEYVSCYGADGHYHDVPVDWVEYVPVKRCTPLRVFREEEFDGSLPVLFCRRSLVFC